MSSLDRVPVRQAEAEEARLADHRLTQLVIKPTVFCYHKCPYCDPRQDYYKEMLESRRDELRLFPAEGDRSQTPGHMPLDMAVRTIRQAATLGMKSLQLSGGDPLMYPQLLEVIREGARHPGVFVFMNSVGTGITSEKAREIIAAGLGAWNFSVDTLDPIKYERLRGVRNGLAKIMEAIEVVREAAADWPEFCINYMTVITKQNFHDIPNVLRHCLDTGVASIYLMNVYGDTSGASLLDEQEVNEFRDEVVPLMLSILREHHVPDIVQTNAATVLGSFYARENSDSNYARGIYWPDMESAKKACGVPNYYALVEPDGRVLPCCLVEISHEGGVGNVSDGGLAHVWTDGGYAAFRRDRIPFCQRCSSPRNRTLGLIPKMCRQFNE